MTSLRDRRQATLGASYSIDRELGSGRAECVTSLRARAWSGHHKGLQCRLELGPHVEVNLYSQAGA
jgi:hypothetical protein